MTRKIGIYRDARKSRPYIVRWFGLPDITTGKRKRYSKAFKTEAEAQQFQAKQLLSFADGRPRDEASEVTLKQLCDDWRNRPIVGTLATGGPAALAGRAGELGFVPADGYAGKCHLCWSVRRFLAAAGYNGEELGPAWAYGV